MKAVSAEPWYDLGDRVGYRDREGRFQCGHIKAIEATWHFHRKSAPLIVYTVEHPSYRDKRFYTTAEAAFFEEVKE